MKTRRKERAEARGRRSLIARRSRMAAVIRALGLWEAFEHRSMPAHLREWFLDLHSPRPEVVPADGLAGDPGVARLMPRLQELLKRVAFPCPPLGEAFAVSDYFALVKPLADCVAGAARSPVLNRRVEFFDKGIGAVAEVGGIDAGARAVAVACHALGFALLPHDRIDTRVHALAVDGGRSAGGRWWLRLVLGVHALERVEVEIDGGRRPVTRVPCSCPTGLEWIEWPAAVWPGAGGGPLPVYVQSHALRAVAERLNVCDGDEWLLHQHLCHSLAAPVVVRRDGPDCRVEFRIADTKVGYLVCQRVGGRVVRTFLFLTVDGTPEGDRLRRVLRLTRADKEYLGLDRFRTFLHTDLAADADVARLLGDCGCERLFALADEAADAGKESGQAGLVRKYVGLPVG